MNVEQVILAAKLAWKHALKPLMKWRIALARRREAAKAAKLVTCMFLVAAFTGCASLDPFWVWVGDLVDKVPAEQPQNPTNPQTPTNSPSVSTNAVTSGTWRTDVADIKAVNGVATFKTRNVQIPGQSKPNGENEWMIARVNGRGFERLLISTMSKSPDNPGRNPSRIMFMRPGRSDWFWDGRFPMPRPGPDTWIVDVDNRCVRIRLNGAEIWRSEQGEWSIESMTMMGYKERGMIGEWCVD